MKWIFGLLMLLLPGAAGVGFSLAVLWQDDANQRFVPVDATVLSTEVRAHSGKSTSYSPEATYTYIYQGKQYQSTRVLAFSMSASSSWARDVLNEIHYKAGPGPEAAGALPATAYVDSDSPEEAILVRRYAIFPYGFAMGGMIAALFGIGYLTGVIGGGRTKMAALALDDSGWQLLLPKVNLRRQFRNSIVIFCGSIVGAIPMPAHWVFVARQGGAAAFFSWALALGVIGIAGALMYRRWNVCRHVSDARLRMRPVPLRRGEAIAMEVEADALSPLRVRELHANLICTEHYKEKSGNKTTYGTRKHLDKKVALGGAAEIPAGEVLNGKGEVTLSDCPATSEIVEKVYPYYTWEVRLVAELEGMVDYAAVFPVDVA